MKKKLLLGLALPFLVVSCANENVKDEQNNENAQTQNNINETETNHNNETETVNEPLNPFEVLTVDYEMISFSVAPSVVRCEFFEIENHETRVFADQESFDAFKSKVLTLISDESKRNSIPNIDFSKEKVAVSAFFGDENTDSYEVNFVKKEGNEVIQSINYSTGAPKESVLTAFLFVTLPIDDNSKITTLISEPLLVKKPIIYFYPEEKMELDVKFVDENRLLTTYPKYNNGWHLNLNENGNFTVDGSDREYYALYFDEQSNFECTFEEGFYVTKENAMSFLEEKMDYMGFTNRETDEFIMYWLPILEENEKSLVYFEQTDDRNLECPLEFSTNPDTFIRTIIHIKKVYSEVEIKEQELTHYERTGFVVTEWGGTTY